MKKPALVAALILMLPFSLAHSVNDALAVEPQNAGETEEHYCPMHNFMYSDGTYDYYCQMHELAKASAASIQSSAGHNGLLGMMGAVGNGRMSGIGGPGGEAGMMGTTGYSSTFGMMLPGLFLHDMMGYGFGGLGYVGMLLSGLLWIGVIALVIYLLLKISGAGKQTVAETPSEILKKRYAKGEITKNQFEEMKRHLRV